MPSDRGTVIGFSNWLLFGITAIGVVVFLLNESKRCGESAQFCSLLIFLGIFTISWVALIALAISTGKITVSGVQVSVVQLFFTQEPKGKNFLWYPGGFLAVWGISYISLLLQQPLLGIFGSGIIMMLAFFATKTAMIPILIHGTWNAYVVLQNFNQIGSILPTIYSTSPIYVPNIGVDIFNQRLLSEIFTHMILVAPAEELFKIFMYAFFVLILKLKFKTDDFLALVIAGVLSVSIWSIYHLSLAIR